MNRQLKQRMEQTLSQLPPQYQSELLDFGDFLAAKLQANRTSASCVEDALLLVREMVNTPAKGRLGPPFLDLTGFKLNREEANER
jgi:hypothetical protein